MTFRDRWNQWMDWLFPMRAATRALRQACRNLELIVQALTRPPRDP